MGIAQIVLADWARWEGFSFYGKMLSNKVDLKGYIGEVYIIRYAVGSCGIRKQTDAASVLKTYGKNPSLIDEVLIPTKATDFGGTRLKFFVRVCRDSFHHLFACDNVSGFVCDLGVQSFPDGWWYYSNGEYGADLEFTFVTNGLPHHIIMKDGVFAYAGSPGDRKRCITLREVIF